METQKKKNFRIGERVAFKPHANTGIHKTIKGIVLKFIKDMKRKTRFALIEDSKHHLYTKRVNALQMAA